jgi:saccharopine dehydrogenase-like NADP-dependent oxidoreductase
VTYQDVVVILCTIAGWQRGQLAQRSDARKIYARHVDGQPWSAIQIATAAGVCAALDLSVAGTLPRKGFLRQEQIGFDDFIANRFGRHFDTRIAHQFTSDPAGRSAEPLRAEGDPHDD